MLLVNIIIIATRQFGQQLSLRSNRKRHQTSMEIIENIERAKILIKYLCARYTPRSTGPKLFSNNSENLIKIMASSFYLSPSPLRLALLPPSQQVKFIGDHIQRAFYVSASAALRSVLQWMKCHTNTKIFFSFSVSHEIQSISSATNLKRSSLLLLLAPSIKLSPFSSATSELLLLLRRARNVPRTTMAKLELIEQQLRNLLPRNWENGTFLLFYSFIIIFGYRNEPKRKLLSVFCHFLSDSIIVFLIKIQVAHYWQHKWWL